MILKQATAKYICSARDKNKVSLQGPKLWEIWACSTCHSLWMLWVDTDSVEDTKKEQRFKVVLKTEGSEKS